jgi:hypothetical protein
MHYRSGAAPAKWGVFDEDQLRMADIIQSVFESRLPDVCGRIRSALEADSRTSSEDKDRLCKVVIPDKLLKSAIINAIYESKLDSNAIGDNGSSVGLFQLHIRGAGVGMTVAERQNPIRNTERILEEFARRLAESPMYASLLGREVAAMASKNPAVAGGADAYTAAWTKEVERPADPNEGEHRGRTAREVFPSEHQESLYERYVAPMVEPVVRPLAPMMPGEVSERLLAPSTAPVFGPAPKAPDHTVRNLALGAGGLFFAGALALSLSKLAEAT